MFSADASQEFESPLCVRGVLCYPCVTQAKDLQASWCHYTVRSMILFHMCTAMDWRPIRGILLFCGLYCLCFEPAYNTLSLTNILKRIEVIVVKPKIMRIINLQSSLVIEHFN